MEGNYYVDCKLRVFDEMPSKVTLSNHENKINILEPSESINTTVTKFYWNKEKKKELANERLQCQTQATKSLMFKT